MLGLDNPIHILFVLIVLLLVFGAKRLPEMGKSMGEGLRGFKDSISGESSVNPMTADDHEPQRVEEITPATPVVTPVTPVVTPEREHEHVAEPTRVGTAA